jgi:Uma2 family endonuclease
MSAQPQPRLTPEEYLAFDRAAPIRYEYYDGQMWAMAGGSYHHANIIDDTTGELYVALKGGPCEVTSSELRVCISPAGLYTYPDLLAVCGEPKFLDGHNDTLLNPTLIIEVLSPSTELHDRKFKAAQYRKIESVQEYALIAQEEPRVEVYRRQPGGAWLLTEFEGLAASCRFESVNCTLALSDIYRRVTFSSPAPPPRPPEGP